MKPKSPDVEPVELLDAPGSRVQPLPLPCAAHNLQLLPGWELLLEFLIHLASQLGKVFSLVLNEAEGVLGEGVEHVQAVDLVALSYGHVKADNGKLIGLGDSQGRVQASNEVRHLVERDELGGVGVKRKN